MRCAKGLNTTGSKALVNPAVRALTRGRLRHVANAIVAWNLVAAHHALDQLEAEGKPVPPELQRHFSPTLNAHINKIGKFDIDPNRGSPLRDLIQPGELPAGASFH